MARCEVPSPQKGVRAPGWQWRPTPRLQCDLAAALPGAGARVVGLAAPEAGGRVALGTGGAAAVAVAVRR